MKFFAMFLVMAATMASAATVQVTETCKLMDGPDFRTAKQITNAGVAQVAMEKATLITVGQFSFWSRVTNATVWLDGVKSVKSGWCYTPHVSGGVVAGQGTTMVSEARKGSASVGVISGGVPVNIVREAVNAWQVTVGGVTGWIWAGAAKVVK